MNTLRLSDGTEIPVFYCAKVQDTLWVHLPNNVSVADGAALFADESALQTILYLNDETETQFDGYTETIRVARNEFTEETVVVLKKEV